MAYISSDEKLKVLGFKRLDALVNRFANYIFTGISGPDTGKAIVKGDLNKDVPHLGDCFESDGVRLCISQVGAPDLNVFDFHERTINVCIG